MYPRVEYEMTEKDLNEMLSACKPVVAIKIGNYVPSSPQQNANRAWKVLGKKMGFESDTVRPIAGKGHGFFTAVPSETDEQRKERENKEAEQKRFKEIDRLRTEIQERESDLKELLTQ